jgi:hypothetical protein
MTGWTWLDIIGTSICVGSLLSLGYWIFIVDWPLEDYRDYLKELQSKYESKLVGKELVIAKLKGLRRCIYADLPVSPQRDALLKWLNEFLESLL